MPHPFNLGFEYLLCIRHFAGVTLALTPDNRARRSERQEIGHAFRSGAEIPLGIPVAYGERADLHADYH